MRLGHDIVYLIRSGNLDMAESTLAAQRRIATFEAGNTVRAWMAEHMPPAGSSGILPCT